MLSFVVRLLNGAAFLERVLYDVVERILGLLHLGDGQLSVFLGLAFKFGGVVLHCLCVGLDGLGVPTYLADGGVALP